MVQFVGLHSPQPHSRELSTLAHTWHLIGHVGRHSNELACFLFDFAQALALRWVCIYLDDDGPMLLVMHDAIPPRSCWCVANVPVYGHKQSICVAKKWISSSTSKLPAYPRIFKVIQQCINFLRNDVLQFFKCAYNVMSRHESNANATSILHDWRISSLSM